jgi:serine/threonine-protein kinase HipA
VLAEHSQFLADELRRLAAMMTFTVAIGNTDAHLRNHALLHGTGTVSLAPIFDAAPTAKAARTRQLALWVDEQPILAFVTYRHLIQEMVGWGLTEDSAGEVADATLAALADSYAEAAQAVPEVSPEVVADCETRTASMLRHR